MTADRGPGSEQEKVVPLRCKLHVHKWVLRVNDSRGAVPRL